MSGGRGLAGKPRGPRLKTLVIPLFGADRIIGTFPTALHSDMRHLVEMLRRNKLPRLARERLAALEEALAGCGSDGGSTPAVGRNVAELRAQMEVWRLEGKSGFDADRYYDAARVSGYTEHNRGSQEDLACRTLQLSSLETGPPKVASFDRGDVETREKREGLLVMDLGCGSGLSTAAAARLPGYALGTDWIGFVL